MSSVAHDASIFVPPAEVEEVELYHPKTFVGKYIWSQDAKIIAVQYAITAIGIGLVALVLSWLMRLQQGFPDRFSFINPSNYLQFVTDRKSTRLNSSHEWISYAVFCLTKN